MKSCVLNALKIVIIDFLKELLLNLEYLESVRGHSLTRTKSPNHIYTQSKKGDFKSIKALHTKPSIDTEGIKYSSTIISLSNIHHNHFLICYPVNITASTINWLPKNVPLNGRLYFSYLFLGVINSNS